MHVGVRGVCGILYQACLWREMIDGHTGACVRVFPSFIPHLLPHSLLQFQGMCDETHSWINEKDQALSTEDFGRDLASVQALQRRHQVCGHLVVDVVCLWGHAHVCVYVYLYDAHVGCIYICTYCTHTCMYLHVCSAYKN